MNWLAVVIHLNDHYEHFYPGADLVLATVVAQIYLVNDTKKFF